YEPVPHFLPIGLARGGALLQLGIHGGHDRSFASVRLRRISRASRINDILTDRSVARPGKYHRGRRRASLPTDRSVMAADRNLQGRGAPPVPLASQSTRAGATNASGFPLRC